MYAVAGVHCVDVAADAAVVHAARLGLHWARQRTGASPWLMVSISDGSDVHFRKAVFDPQLCPADCPRPCERVCPADAITAGRGVEASVCYGCGRCLPACPLQLIHAQDHRVGLEGLSPLLQELQPDALEIHTAPERSAAFARTLLAVAASGVPLQRLAVSCGLEGHGVTPADLATELWARHGALRRLGLRPLWQLDGRPMSGDVGAGTARAALRLWQELRAIAPPGPLQLAGGTNDVTISLVQAVDPAPGSRLSGVAFGGMARALIQPLLQQAEKRQTTLREWPSGWDEAVALARSLVEPWLRRV